MKFSLQNAVSIVADKIKRIEIQGARNVAIAAIKAIQDETKKTKASSKKEFINDLLEAKNILFNSRATEPLMRNSIRYLIHEIEASNNESVKEMVDLVSEVAEKFLRNLEQSKENIAKVGSRRIFHHSRILTHCHSSTVTGILRKAKLDGKSFEVVCTESRPVFQGRITAKEMLNSGIKTTMIVDSAVRHFMNQVDLVMVGADAITSEGNVINKIGTSMVALAAKEARTPFYVVSDLLKFDPLTIHGEYEKLEERSSKEVWDNSPAGLIIRNPAFDVTRREFIHGIICEEGIISPHSINEVIFRKYPWVLDVY